LDREEPKAAVGRLQTLLRSYPDSDLIPEALYLLGETYLEMKQAKKAYKTFQQLLQQYPNSDYADDARDHIRS
jgi:outer membrane protein assembly factor BamD (BamD/ComL family)